MDKQGMEFWIFALDDPELYKFYTEHETDSKLCYAILIERTPPNLPAFVLDVLHLHKANHLTGGNVLLLIKSYLLPVYYKLGVGGYAIILSEDFCKFDEYKALMKFCFFYNKPEAIIDMEQLNGAQLTCIDLCYREYNSQYDDMSSSVILNLLINLVLQSDIVNYEIKLRSGHLLMHALAFVALVDEYAFAERKKSFYAEQLAITEKLLDLSLREIFGKTFREILNNCVIIEALYMLIFTDKSVNQISHELNYDTSDFNRLFVKYKGGTPREVREMLRKVVDYVQNGY